MINISEIIKRPPINEPAAEEAKPRTEQPEKSFEKILRDSINTENPEKTAKNTEKTEKNTEKTEKKTESAKTGDQNEEKTSAVNGKKEHKKESVETLTQPLLSLIESLTPKSGGTVKESAIKEAEKALASHKKIPDAAEMRLLRKAAEMLKEALAGLEKKGHKIDELKTLLAGIEKKLDLRVKIRETAVRDILPQESRDNHSDNTASAKIRDQVPVERSHANTGDNSGSKNEFAFHFNKNQNITERSESAKNSALPRQSFDSQLNEIIDRARIQVKDGKNGSFSMKLFPRALGGLNVNLGLENGVLHGRFLVETMEAKSLLLNSLSGMMQELADSGLSLGEFQVNVKDGGENSGNESAEKSQNPFYYKDDVSASAEYQNNSFSAREGGINLLI